MTEFISPYHPRITQWNLRDFEWMGILTTGKIPAYDCKTGERLVDRSTLRRRKMTEAEILTDEQRKRRRVAPVLETSVPPNNNYFVEGMPIEKMVALRLKLGADTPIIPAGAKAVDFSDASITTWLSRIVFKLVDVIDYERSHGLVVEEQKALPIPETPDIPAHAPEQTDPEAFIRFVSISYESDTEVSIKVGDNKAKNYTCGKMGFKSSENGWKLLMEVLANKNHLFYVGPYSKDRIPEKNKRYNQRQKWIPQFTKKFITFLNSEYPVRIPDKTILLENQKKKDRDGLYKPIFHVASNDAINSTDIKKMSQHAVLKKIKTLVNDRKREKNAEVRESLLSLIGDHATHAYKNGWITQEQLRKMISLPDEEVPVSPDDALSYSGESNTANNF